MRKNQRLFFIEHTDTFGGEANYSWVTRYIVSANTPRGAMRKVAPTYWRYDWGNRYNSTSGCTCYFVEEIDSEEAERLESQYSRIERM
jgi:hypothetical protein